MNRRSLLIASAALAASSPGFAQTRGGFAAALAYNAAQAPSSLLIARYGVVLAETYVGASASARWDLGAAGRMFSPLCAAALAKDRLLNLSEPVAMTLGDWGAHPVKNTITIRALLNGTSGIGTERHRDDLTLSDAIALEPLAAPGQSFIDDPAPYLLFSEIARRKLLTVGATPDPALYLMGRLLSDIGCAPMAWSRNANGVVRFDSGVQVSLRAWAQAAELLRRDGIYRAQQIIDPGVVREARQGSFTESRAGMGLWLMSTRRDGTPDMRIETDFWRAAPNPPLDLAMAAGAQGQRMYIFPSDGLIIVRAGASANWSDAAFLETVLREI